MNKSVSLAMAGLFALAAAFLLPAPADAAGYLKLGDIKGEATDRAQKDQIEILSYSWGAAQSRSATTSTPTGESPYQPITIRKKLDKASPLLMEAAAAGSVIDEVELVLPNDNRTEVRRIPYLKYKLTGVVVTSYQSGGSSEGDSDSEPTETFILDYEGMEVTPASRTVIQKNQSDLEMVRERSKRTDQGRE